MMMLTLRRLAVVLIVLDEVEMRLDEMETRMERISEWMEWR